MAAPRWMSERTKAFRAWGNMPITVAWRHCFEGRTARQHPCRDSHHSCGNLGGVSGNTRLRHRLAVCWSRLGVLFYPKPRLPCKAGVAKSLSTAPYRFTELQRRFTGPVEPVGIPPASGALVAVLAHPMKGPVVPFGAGRHPELPVPVVLVAPWLLRCRLYYLRWQGGPAGR